MFESADARDSPGYAGLLRSMAARLRIMGRNAEAVALYREAQALPASAQIFTTSLDLAEGPLPTRQEPAYSSGGCPTEVFSARLDAELHQVSAPVFSDTVAGSILQCAVANFITTPRETLPAGEAPRTPPCTTPFYRSPPAAATEDPPESRIDSAHSEDTVEWPWASSSLSMSTTMSPCRSAGFSALPIHAESTMEFDASGTGPDSGAGDSSLQMERG